MIRSILVVVDDSGSSLAGARCAFDLARRCGAYVEIRRSKFVPIGGLTSKTMLDLGLLERADKRISAVLKSFREDAGGTRRRASKRTRLTAIRLHKLGWKPSPMTS